MSKVSVIVTREQATEALLTRAEFPFAHLIRRFKEEHGLEFKESDFNDKSRFSFSYDGDSESDARAFKVTYFGGGA